MAYTKKIMYIAGLIFVTAILFLYINIYFIFPSVSDLVVKSTVKEAVLATKMLSSMSILKKKGVTSIPADIDMAIIKHRNDFGFDKIKFFSADGEVIYSTDPGDIGDFNRDKYFIENVASGEIYTKTLEGWKVDTDILETYVPVMDGDRFLGAFEIYYDVTSRNNAINSIAIRYSVLSLLLIFSFMVLSILILAKEDRSGSYSELGILSKIYQSPVYILLILMVSLFIIEAIIMRIMVFLPELSSSIEAILNALLLVMLTSPVLYLFLLRPISQYIKERNKAENALKNAHDILEETVDERTAELSKTILELEKQIENRKKAEETIIRQLSRLESLHTIDMAITSNYDLHATLEVFLNQVMLQLEVDAATVLLMDQKLSILEYASSQGFRTSALKYTKVKLGESIAGRAAIERKILDVPDLRITPKGFSRSEFFAEEDFVSYFAVPLIAKGKVNGILEVFYRSHFEPDEDWLNFLQAIALQAAIAIDDAKLFEDLHRSNIELAIAYESTLEGWAKALEIRDKETHGHSRRVTQLTLRVARKLGINDDDLEHIKRGALLHDIGKMGIPDSILHKPGKLTGEEWEIMKKHTSIAYDLLHKIEHLRPALDIPYYHHEKWDGTGYPKGLKGDRIPLAARIFAVVDVWDALLSDRPYRKAWPEKKVIDHIQSESGKHFDPEVVKIFMMVI